jgi:quercetin dioxygenase-like cupin family protein
MNAKPEAHTQEHLDLVSLYVLQSLPPREIAAAEAQIASCADCAQEVAMLRRVVQSFAGWDAEVLRPAESLWGRLANRIAAETGAPPFTPPPQETRAKPEWEEAAPGIHVKILAANAANDSVSMLVRLDPGTDYPGHTHAGVEELHLLHGVLKVDDKTYYPGDFLRAEPGSVDHRVWSETGCTCFLMTSTKDVLF